MKITKLKVRDFQGLSGDRTYDEQTGFGNRLVALIDKNGTGKTSVLNAIKCALIGDADGKILRDNSAASIVGVMFEDGDEVIREFTAGGQRAWLNKRAIRQSDLAKAVQARTGLSPKTLKIATSEMLVGLKPQELGDLIMSYLPETLDADTVLSYSGLSSDGQAYVRGMLPGVHFGVSAVDAVYQQAYAARRDARKALAEKEAALRAFSAVIAPTETRDTLVKRRNALLEAHAKAAAYRAAKEAYDKSVLERNRIVETIDRLKAEWGNIPVQPVNDQEIVAKRELIAQKEAQWQDLGNSIRALTQSGDALAKAIQQLSTPVCPLSDKLVCTTDKTVVDQELKDALSGCSEEIAKQQNQLSGLVNELSELKRAVQEMEQNQRNAARRDQLKRQIEEAERTLPAMPVLPPAVDGADSVLSDMEAVNASLIALDQVQQREVIERELSYARNLTDTLDAVVACFGPKGEVRSRILAGYLQALSDSVNQTAEMIRPGMRMRFVQKDGLIPLLDVNGNDMYMSYSALSGGERVFMLFLLLDMLNSLTGLRMLFLDELSVLDAEAFLVLLGVLGACASRYDQVFIAMADHDDMRRALVDNGIIPVEI